MAELAKKKGVVVTPPDPPPPPKKDERKATPTGYVILMLGNPGEWSPLCDEHGELDVYPGSTGQAAIKLARHDGYNAEDEDVYLAGSFHAVPLSTWESKSNQLIIEVETKPVTTFRTPT